MNRRQFIQTAAAGALAGPVLANDSKSTARLAGKADHCIMIWLGGGMAHIDTFDPKKMGDAKAKDKKPGSYYPAIDTSVPGVQLCEHLQHTAKMMENVTVFAHDQSRHDRRTRGRHQSNAHGSAD